MELQDYWVALRRYWTTWLGVALAGLLVALCTVLFTPPTYQATAQVFVASVDGSTSGSQFVNQRVTSYPEVADSRTVLAPVIEELGLSDSFSDVRKAVTATNPVDTSQIEIVVADGDAGRAAQIANAVAERFGTAVEKLEQPQEGASPVSLTVTNPATVPTSPTSPAPALLLPLGLIVGTLLGAAAAIVRSRLDTRLHSADDVRAAWGAGADQLVVHAAPAGRRHRGFLPHRATTMLARQLEPMAEQQLVPVVALSPSADQAAAGAVVDRVAAELIAWDVEVGVLGTGPATSTGAPGSPGVRLRVGSPLAPLPEWRQLARASASVVLVVEPGRIDRGDLTELRSILDAAGVPVLAVVLPSAEPRRIRRRNAAQAPAPLSSVAARRTPAAQTVAGTAGSTPGVVAGRR
jgi:capsular polysaccharide biosynthesis protein